MKRIFILFFFLCLLAGCFASPAPPAKTAIPTATTDTAPQAAPGPAEIRALWLSYYDLTLPEGGISEQTYRGKYGSLFDEVAGFGFNTLFVHVRPFTDATYPSAIYPWSEILTGAQGADPGYDPLGILCELAGARGLEVHAWLNPFRITPDHRDLSKLARSNPALAHIAADDGWVRQADGRYYWNPAVPEVHALVYDGARELLENYPLAGIHIDDYFYPTREAAFDAAQYGAYRARGGALPLDDWRREMVSQFVAGLYRAVHRARPEAVLSVSPAANMPRNYGECYADAARWMREPGFADWMVPQVYYGFGHAKLPFGATARAWAELPRHGGLRLVFGL
ncbi:MAG: family 10 glycosylhydrolase, partial [Oscillospiraceae bacterium]|nr:family 10 glycosylhydrolase [Oscillospiraceae bacterium]